LAPEQYYKPALLTIIQALVKGRCGGGQLLQVGRAGAQALGLGDRRDYLDVRILISLVLIGCALLSPSGEPLGALSREVADRRFKRRPILFLFRVQFESGFEGGYAGVEKRCPILRAKTTMLFPLCGIVRHGKARAQGWN
jgi:hypothetical protein